MPTDRKTAMKLRKEYPNYVPVKVAAVYLGVSACQLSWLVAEGRQPYASIGGNIGTNGCGKITLNQQGLDTSGVALI